MSSCPTGSDTVIDNLGVPAGGINLAFGDASLVAQQHPPWRDSD
jgi:hypothetical protein